MLRRVIDMEASRRLGRTLRRACRESFERGAATFGNQEQRRENIEQID